MEDAARERWFLTGEERGNPATELQTHTTDSRPWSDGNLVRPLIHGATYFRRLLEELAQLSGGDRIYFTDWRGDPDELLAPAGPTVVEMLSDLARCGVEVRGLVWRSHSDHLNFSAQESQHLGTQVNEAGAEVMLDQRVHRFGSHHQKMFVIRHPAAVQRDVAFVGGIDLCHGRRDDASHSGDPQQQRMDPRYGDRAPWHDAALEIRGPVIGDLLRTFTERWDDPTPLDRRTPYRMLIQRKARMPRHPDSLPTQLANPPAAGPHSVQVLRTYASKRPRYPFAPDGERSVARAYEKAFRQARSLIYVEDQYLWSEPVAEGIAKALRASPELQLIAVVPRYPDADGRVSGAPNRLGQIDAMKVLHEAAPERVGIFDLENIRGVPIYVHAKVCIVDDVWLTCGSDNFNRRSWTNDSELTCAVLDTTRDDRQPLDPGGQGDGARQLARDFRVQLWAEHLGRPVDDPALIPPGDALRLWQTTADDLDGWYRDDQLGPRPKGQARAHRPQPVSKLQRLWAGPLYRAVFDPDGRPKKLRRAHQF